MNVPIFAINSGLGGAPASDSASAFISPRIRMVVTPSGWDTSAASAPDRPANPSLYKHDERSEARSTRPHDFPQSFSIATYSAGREFAEMGDHLSCASLHGFSTDV
jgi:hypothetical protein